MNYFDCTNKLVIVTGASSGIGASVAKAFARRGAHVALIGRHESRLKEVVGDIQKQNGQAKDFIFDLTHTEQIPALLNEIQAYFKQPIDILVNSAGLGVLGFIEHVPLKAYEEGLKVNFAVPLVLIQTVLPQMKNTGGQIINITSGVGSQGLPGVSPYCVSKFALNALTESLRLETAGQGIDVISFSPGLVKSNFASSLKIYGPIKETFTKGASLDANVVAQHIVMASYHRRSEVILSWRARATRHLKYWFPGILNRMLIKLSKGSS